MEHIYEARILLVDDQPDILEMLKSILARRGFRNVRTASDCRSARSSFDEYAPQMVILDIMLPDGDGFSLMLLSCFFLQRTKTMTDFWDLVWVRTTILPSLSFRTN